MSKLDSVRRIKSDPAEAAKAVNPRDLADVEPEDKGSGE